MPAAHDGSRAIVKMWFREYLHRNTNDDDELGFHHWIYVNEGPGKCLTGILTSDEGQERMEEDRLIREHQLYLARQAKEDGKIT